MTPALCLGFCLLALQVAEGPDSEDSSTPLRGWCPKAGPEVTTEFKRARARKREGETESALVQINTAIDLNRGNPDCSTLHALRGSIYFDLAQARAASKGVVGKGFDEYDEAVKYDDVLDLLKKAEDDLAFAFEAEQPRADEPVSQKLAQIRRSITQVDKRIAQRERGLKEERRRAEEERRRAEAARRRAEEDQRQREIARAAHEARIWGGLSLVGGGLTSTVGVTLLGRTLLVEGLDCRRDGTCFRDIRRASLASGAALSLIGGSLLGLGLHQFAVANRLDKPSSSFPKRRVGIALVLVAIAPLAIGGACLSAGEVMWDRAALSDMGAWQSANRRTNIGSAILGLTLPILGSGIGLLVAPRGDVVMRVRPSATGATLTLQF